MKDKHYTHRIRSTLSALERKDPKLPVTLWLLSVFAIFYGTLIPFEFHGDADLALSRALRATEFTAPWLTKGGLSTPDIVQNVLLFLPFGFCAYLSRAHFAITLVAAVLLSLSVECLQLFTAARVTSWLDLATNSIGATIGYLLAPGLLQNERALRRLALRAGLSNNTQSLLAIALLCLAIAHHFHPFAPTLDIGFIWQQLKALPDTFYLRPERGDGLTVLHWTLASCLIGAAVRQQVTPLRCALALALIAFTAEFCQFAIRARMPGFHDIIFAVASIIAGVLISSRRTLSGLIEEGHSRHMSGAFLPLFTLALFLITAAWDTLYPFQLEMYRGITWLPFEQSYNRTSFTKLSNAMELLFSGLAVALIFGCYTPGRAARILASLLAIAGFAMLEVCQAWIAGRYAGTEDIIALALGIWLGLRLSRGLLATHPETPDQHDPSESLTEAGPGAVPYGPD